MKRVSWIRVSLLVVGLLALVPATVVFGIFGFAGVLFFMLLAVLAK